MSELIRISPLIAQRIASQGAAGAWFYGYPATVSIRIDTDPLKAALEKAAEQMATVADALARITDSEIARARRSAMHAAYRRKKRGWR